MTGTVGLEKRGTRLDATGTLHEVSQDTLDGSLGERGVVLGHVLGHFVFVLLNNLANIVDRLPHRWS